MSKKILFNDEARLALKRGIDIAANAAKVTIGPRGRNVALGKGFGGPTITNDGVSIVKEISLADPFENMGVEIVKEVANKTNDAAGDGTTTATVLLQAIVDEGMRHMQSGVEVMGIKRGIESASHAVVEELKKNAKTIKSLSEIKQVATVSAESEELGTIIAETIDKVGQDGVVTVEESQGFDMTSEVVEGMQFDKGYISPYMITDTERMEAVYHNVPVLIYEKKISTIKDILPLLEKLTQRGQKELVIIAEDVDGEALTTFVVNKLRGALNVLAVKAPGFGDRRKAMLEDIAIVTGATVITEEKGMKLEDAGLDVLGNAKKIIATKDSTTIIDGKGKKSDITTRVEQLKMQLDATTSTFDKEKIEERIAKLAGGVAVIKVGAATETEIKYLKLKIEDAVNATKAALEEGVVAGGGSALVQASASVRATLAKKKFASREEEIGYEIILNACEAPLRQIGINSGKGDGSIIIEKVKALVTEANGSSSNGGYNSATDEYVKDMINAGIIDPVMVTRHALTNASSAAGTFLTTQVAIANEPEEKKTSMMPGGAGMGGMDMGY
jgi:chaperonin GroEL